MMRHKFFGRAAFVVTVLVILTVSACTLTFWLTFLSLQSFNEMPHMMGNGRDDWGMWWGMTGGPRWLPWFLLIFLGMLVSGWLFRMVRQIASPIGALLNAVSKVGEGDYTVRLSERGPRDMRALSRAFNRMTAQLQYNDEQRRRLLADVTHELRTPVAVIQGNLEAILDDVYPADAEHLTMILDETHVLSRLIEDLRTLSLAESGALHLHRESTDLGLLIEDALNAYRQQAEAKGVTLVSNIAPDLPLLEIDPVRIREVVTNLLANALRYTEQGGTVHVAAKLEAVNVGVEIKDTGSGISPELLPHLFNRFAKSTESRGSGLGLAIAKNLVEAHGGTITAESTVGQGTCIRFSVPLATT